MCQLIFIVSLLVVVSVQVQNMKFGFWEVRQQLQFDFKCQVQMEKVQQQMVVMLVEQCKMMEEMMVKCGVSMDFGGGGVIMVKMCVSEEQVKCNELLVVGCVNCMYDVQCSGDQIYIKFSCINLVFEGISDVMLWLGGDGFIVRIYISYICDGKIEVIDVIFEVCWFGVDCGGLKLMGSK